MTLRYVNVCSCYWFDSIYQVPKLLYLCQKFTKELGFTVDYSPSLVKWIVGTFVEESEGWMKATRLLIYVDVTCCSSLMDSQVQVYGSSVFAVDHFNGPRPVKYSL